MKKFVLILIGIGVISFCGCSSNNPEVDAAFKSAQDWLKLIDSQRYEQSWEEAADFFRNAVPKDKWLEAMESMRQPVGKNISREVQSKSYKTQLSGAPDGEYVVIKFNSSFENKKSAKEIVTPMLDKDGVWRISGYYMK